MKEMNPDRDDSGLGLKPGDPHYRAYFGPPEDYDLIAAMTFLLEPEVVTRDSPIKV